MSSTPLRYEKLIKLLPNAKSATQAIREAGFTEHTARTQQKRVLQSAMRYQRNKMLEESPLTMSTTKLMSELIGMSRQDVFNALRDIAVQTKDLNSALKVLAPLAKEHGVILSNEDTKTTVVPLTIVMEDGSAKPDIKDSTVESYNIDCTTLTDTVDDSVVEGVEGTQVSEEKENN